MIFIMLLFFLSSYSYEYEMHKVEKGESLSLILINKGVSYRSLLGKDQSPGLLVENINLNPEVKSWYTLNPGQEIRLKLVPDNNVVIAENTNVIKNVEPLEQKSDELDLVNTIEPLKDENEKIETLIKEDKIEQENVIYKNEYVKNYFSQHKISFGLGILYLTETQKNSQRIKMDPSFLFPILGYTYKYRSSTNVPSWESSVDAEVSYVIKHDSDEGVDLPLNLKLEFGLARYATLTFDRTSFSPYLGIGYRVDNSVTANLVKEARTTKTFYLSFSPEFETVFNNYTLAYNLFYNLGLASESEGEDFSNYELGVKTELSFNRAWSYFFKYYYSYFENESDDVNIVAHKGVLGMAYKF